MHDMEDNGVERQREVSLGGTFENGGRMDELLIAKILSKLPTEAIFRFKRVCKSWYYLIRSPHFASKHLKHYYDNINNRCLILQYIGECTEELNVCKLMVEHRSMQVISSELIEPLKCNTYMCGPCDGIYFLSNIKSETYRNSLWNPALNELVQLPNIISKPNLESYMIPSVDKAYGFGFDSKAKDYKVVAIEGYGHKCPLSVFIYSLKSNSWRYWGDLKNSYHLLHNSSYSFVNGCYYWLGSRKPFERFHRWHEGYPEVAICFDITADAYEEIPLPKQIKQKKPYYGSQLVVYQDSIAFVYFPQNVTYFSVWTWSERLWKQKLKIEVGCHVEGAINHWWDNVFVFRTKGKTLLWFDTNTKEMGVLHHPSSKRGFENIVIYMESSVSIKELINKTHPKESYDDAEDIDIP